ncbi:hypothetical protein Tco_0527893 [Tanacetum coccineum]
MTTMKKYAIFIKKRLFQRTHTTERGCREIRNRTLVEAAQDNGYFFPRHRCFFGPKAVSTACYNPKPFPYSHTHEKTPYELVHNKKLDLTFFRVFGALCYPTNDSENLGKLQPKADIGIFVDTSPNMKGLQN